MTKKNITLLFFIFQLSFFILPGAEAQDSSHIQVSLLTCTSGEELYSTFGHTAIRIVDSSSLTDVVFNYGTFNFDDPNFYTKFIRGKLLYFISTDNFNDFKDEYQSSNRGITEQILNLSAKDKIDILEFLYNNVKEENKYYKYDFIYDNCTTRIRDIILQHKKNNIDFISVLPKGFTFRNAIHDCLDKTGKCWSKLGIDILLGSPTDKIMSVNESLFLPENLMKTLDKNNQQHLIISSKQLYPLNPTQNRFSIFTPLNIFSFILLMVIFLNFLDSVFIKNFITGLDGLLFCFVGLLGVGLVFMWTSTDHAMCKYNYNLLWALPTHCVMAFFINKKSRWVNYYFIATAIITSVVILIWAFLPQEMNLSLIPFLLLIVYRSTHKVLKK